MNRRFLVPTILWLLALIAAVGSVYFYQLKHSAPPEIVQVTMESIPWNHFREIGRFRLTDQSGKEFDSHRLYGKVYAVSFFFATCPTICRDLNRQVQTANERLKDVDMEFVGISVDPDNDSPDVLGKYANDFGAVPGRWNLLTGQIYQVKELGEQTFQVVVDKATHTDNIFLIDKWGRYRDRFKWDEPDDMKRLVSVARSLAAETEPPLNRSVESRNLLPLAMGDAWMTTPWIKEFALTDQDGHPFFSRDLTGQVWIASFFFSTCPGICPQQNQYLAGLKERTKGKSFRLVSITTDPVNDTPGKLKAYSEVFRAFASDWVFLTGDSKLIERIGSEFFSASSGAGHHSTKLFVVDRWGRIRGRFDWQQADQEIAMIKLIDELNRETVPRPVDNVIDFDSVPKQETPDFEGDTANDGTH